MKKIDILIAFAAALALFAGCSRQEEDFASLPDALTLTAVLENPETRVNLDGTTGKFTWNKGDEIAVHTASSGYQKATVTETSTTVKASATVDETAIMDRDFYAIYPYEAYDAANYGQSGGELNVILPKTYDISDIIAGTSALDRTEDYSPMPMVAVNSYKDSYLYFHPVGGLVRVTCEKVPAGTSKLKVSLDKDISGTFTVDCAGTTTPFIITPGTAADNSTSVEFTIAGSEGIPAEIEDLVLNVPVPCGTYEWVLVECFDSSDTPLYEMIFKGSHTFIRNHGWKVEVQKEPLEYVCGGTVHGVDGLLNVLTSYAGDIVDLAEAFKSYKTDGVQYIPVPFKFQYSGDEGATWTDGLPEWIEILNAVNYSGSTSGMQVNVLCRPLENTMPDSHHDILKQASRKKTDFDLATYNVATNTENTARNTANAYVVRGAGSYKFPLVYGNGVKDGAYNESSYRARKGVGGAYRNANGESFIANDADGTENWTYHYFGYYKDHLNGNITNPYLTTHLGKAATEFTPALVWTDIPGLIDPLSLKITGSGENTYLNFEVPGDYITQGNAIIAVTVDGKIAWSWHIWVTEEDLTDVKAVFNGYEFMPVQIGWCDGQSYAYERRSVLIRAVQTEDEGVISEVVRFTQAGKSEFIFRGNSMVYQWGRKDPFLAAVNGDKEIVKPGYNYSSFNQYFLQEKSSVNIAIQEPHMFYLSQSNRPLDWCTTTYLNYWNSTLDGMSEAQYSAFVTKTVYDPSPVGFKVPPQAAYAGLTDENFVWVENTSGPTGNAGRLLTIPGTVMFFPMTSYRSPNYFPPIHESNLVCAWSAVPESRNYAWDLTSTDTDIRLTRKTDYRDDGRPVIPAKE